MIHHFQTHYKLTNVQYEFIGKPFFFVKLKKKKILVTVCLSTVHSSFINITSSIVFTDTICLHAHPYLETFLLVISFGNTKGYYLHKPFSSL